MTAPQRKQPGRIMFPVLLIAGVQLYIDNSVRWELPGVATWCVGVVAGALITIGVIGISRAYRE